jgi:ABC-type transporter Mla subunit MlaD
LGFTLAASLIVAATVVAVGSVIINKLLLLERKLNAMSSELDQVLAADTATLTAIQTLSTQLTTDVDNLITLIQNGDPAALTAAQALGTNLTSLQTSLQSLDTAAQGAGGAPPAAKPAT